MSKPEPTATETYPACDPIPWPYAVPFTPEADDGLGGTACLGILVILVGLAVACVARAFFRGGGQA